MTYDVIVVGAGPNGMALALALAGAQRARVLLLDAREPSTFAAAGHDTRGTALTKATQNMLKALGCWNDLKDHVAEMRDVIVTDGSGPHGGRPTLLTFTTEPGAPAAAAIAENRHITSALLVAVGRSPAITLRGKSKLSTIDQSNGFVTITCEDGFSARAPLLAGADGRNSSVRTAAGIAIEGHDDGQSALTFTIGHALPHHQRAEEHFSQTGVFALLPLPGNRSSVVWGTNRAEAERLMGLDESSFEKALHERVGNHLGQLQVEGAKQCYPLKRMIALAITAPRTALLGDAAHIIHPLAGLGLNLGFKDVAILAECVATAMARGEDHGDAAVLERYAQWRRFDIVSTITAMEGINTLFANDWPMIRSLRRAGLQIVDAMPTLKHVLMKEASGLTGDVPFLMRGA